MADSHSFRLNAYETPSVRSTFLQQTIQSDSTYEGF